MIFFNFCNISFLVNYIYNIEAVLNNRQLETPRTGDQDLKK